MKILLSLILCLALFVPGCAYNSVIAARITGDKVDATVEGTPVKISGAGVNAIIVYQKFLTFEKGRQVPPLCDVTASETGAYTTVSGGYTTKDNFFSLVNKDVVTKY